MSIIDEAATLEREDWIYNHTPRWRLIEMGMICERCGSFTECQETRAGEMLCAYCGRR